MKDCPQLDWTRDQNVTMFKLLCGPAPAAAAA